MTVNWGTGSNTGISTAASIGVTLGTGSGSPFSSGDIIVIAVVAAASTTASLTGFTAVPSTGNTYHYLYRVCDGSASDPSSTSVTVSSSANTYLSAITFTVTGATGIDPSFTSWSASTLTAASITLGHSGDAVIYLGAEIITANYISTSTYGVPAGYTSKGSQTAGKTSGAGGSRIGSAVWGGELDNASSGATGTQTGSTTQTGTFTNDAVLLAFSPSAVTTVYGFFPFF